MRCGCRRRRGLRPRLHCAAHRRRPLLPQPQKRSFRSLESGESASRSPSGSGQGTRMQAMLPSRRAPNTMPRSSRCLFAPCRDRSLDGYSTGMRPSPASERESLSRARAQRSFFLWLRRRSRRGLSCTLCGLSECLAHRYGTGLVSLSVFVSCSGFLLSVSRVSVDLRVRMD